MMAILILIVLVLAIVHFVYEGIILPTIRLHFRYRLFALRDRLRWLKFQQNDEVDLLSYKYLQETLNIMVAFLYRFDMWAIFEAKPYFQKYPDLQKRVEVRIDALNSCRNEEFKKIMKESFVISCEALICNSAGLFCWFSVPVLFYIIGKGLNQTRKFITNRTMEIFCIPERESETLNQLCI